MRATARALAWPFVEGISAARQALVLTVPMPDRPGGFR